MSTSKWTGAVSSVWDDADNWDPAGVPGVNSDVVIASGAPVASGSIGTVNSITDSSDLSFESAGTNAVTTFLDDAGHLWVDHGAGEGGTTLNIGGTLTNSNHLVIGNTTLSAPDEVTAAALDNTGKGKIYLIGSAADQALLDVAGSAGFGTAGVFSGYARLAGDSAIEFESGEITSLAKKAQLLLNGNDAFIEDRTALGSNSALKGLASVGAGALFALHDGAAVSTTGALMNDGQVYLDTGGGDSGGSSLTLAGALTNSKDLGIGNTALAASDKVTAASFDNTGKIQLTGSGANQALLDVSSTAGFGTAGVLSGSVGLAGDSAIEFASGQITSLAGSLTLDGNDAFIEDSAALGSNSALKGLDNVAGTLNLENGASVSTTGALANDADVYLDRGAGDGGSSLTVAGTLTNYFLLIGNDHLSASDTVTAAALDNSGTISLTGSGANQALLDVTSAAGFGTPGVLSGNAQLAGDSAIEFASGEITSVAGGLVLTLNGNDAFIEDSTARGSNSALTGLASIGAGAFFELEDGASVSTAGALVNNGSIYIDYANEAGGSSLTVAGALTNRGSLNIGYSSALSSSKVLTTALTNTGRISLNGSNANQGLLDVTGSAGFGTAGILSGDVRLAGDSAIEFASGQISTLAAGATLFLDGNSAFIEDSTKLGSNSALSGLSNVAGSLTLVSGASVSTKGALTNTGSISLGGTSASQALLDVTSAAGFGTAGVLSGGVDLSGDSAIEFASGEITSLAASAQLTLTGNDAFIEDSTKLGSNSALTGLASIRAGATLDLERGASVSTTGALANSGSIYLASVGANPPALLDVASAAGFGTAGVLSGAVDLGDSAIEFTSGQITSVASGADLGIVGNDAFIEDSTALGSNSALTGLADIAGELDLDNGASVSTSGALTNGGVLGVDSPSSLGGSTLSIGGALTNSGSLGIGNYSASSSSKVATTALTNTGTISLTGGYRGAQALLDVSGATTNDGAISIATDTEELAGAVSGTGYFSLGEAYPGAPGASLRFDSSVSTGQTIIEYGANALTLEQAQSFAATISGFGTGDTIDAANFHAPPATTYNFVENSGGTGGTLTLTDTSQSLAANILMTGHYSNSSFTLAPDSGTGTLVKFV